MTDFLQSDRRGVIVNLTVIGHRDDAGLDTGLDAGPWPRTQIRDRLLQVRREGGYPAAARKRIADERDTADGYHEHTSISTKCRRGKAVA
jgi:hypothetical protein